MRTIRRHWPSTASSTDCQAMCDVCGVMFRRSQLVRQPGGLLACSGSGTNNDARGRDQHTLDQLNAAGAILAAQVPSAEPAGQPDRTSYHAGDVWAWYDFSQEDTTESLESIASLASGPTMETTSVRGPQVVEVDGMKWAYFPDSQRLMVGDFSEEIGTFNPGYANVRWTAYTVWHPKANNLVWVDEDSNEFTGLWYAVSMSAAETFNRSGDIAYPYWTIAGGDVVECGWSEIFEASEYSATGDLPGYVDAPQVLVTQLNVDGSMVVRTYVSGELSDPVTIRIGTVNGQLQLSNIVFGGAEITSITDEAWDGYGYKGYLGEVRLYRATHDATRVEAVVAELVEKWGIE